MTVFFLGFAAFLISLKDKDSATYLSIGTLAFVLVFLWSVYFIKRNKSE